MHNDHRISFQRILCPIALTPDSDEVLQYAMTLAASFGAKLIVLHCIDNHEAANSIERLHVQQLLEYSIKKDRKSVV